ncbi:MAG: hypothetical protein A2920_03065 [Candidatus Zambryskibacteria bacterium RIFCSPLOWO2_01_FULL_43_17]|uniref:Uncharacterized protein n=1 Tax=Candidatus Zambryskibacteria bacterium RIFCSPLOWO2_01_FULL_43_17 TaxID=1802760 RepID=A0A1G2U424_9BACT|nr:MAG: hypothetical protein A2920_03065 [Candidatus Zambryskibacteria bacterium RIFCSPLOWO2_01_FULL_43_17]
MPNIFFVAIFFGTLSGVLQLSGYVEYFKKVFSGHIKPNSASWGIWAFGAALESISYIYVSDDWIKNILPIVCALSAIAFFIASTYKGHFSRPTKFEWGLIITDFIIIIVWFLTSSPFVANTLLIVTAIISFIPIYINTWKNPIAEHALPWLLWSLAYAMMLIAVFIRWEKWEDMLYPVTFLVLHILMFLFALDYRKIGRNFNNKLA